MVRLLCTSGSAGLVAVLLSVRGLPAGAPQTDNPAANTKQLQELRKEYDRLLKESEARAKQFAEALAVEKKAAAQAEAQRAAFTKALTAELLRVQTEVVALKAALEAREQKLVQQAKEIAAMRDRALAAETTAKAALERAQSLLQQLQKKGQLPAPAKGAKPVNDATALNPSQLVKGTITQVDPKDKTMVVISLGTDEGVRVGHTLEVYRLRPRAEYLGRIRVIEAGARTAVARLLKTAVQASPLKAGDEVASSLHRP